MITRSSATKFKRKPWQQEKIQCHLRTRALPASLPPQAHMSRPLPPNKHPSQPIPESCHVYTTAMGSLLVCSLYFRESIFCQINWKPEQWELNTSQQLLTKKNSLISIRIQSAFHLIDTWNDFTFKYYAIKESVFKAKWSHILYYTSKCQSHTITSWGTYY